MTDHDWLQIEQAARGCISGTLSEWPDLSLALAHAGHWMEPGTPAYILRGVCVELLARRDLLVWLDKRWRQNTTRMKMLSSCWDNYLRCYSYW